MVWTLSALNLSPREIKLINHLGGNSEDHVVVSPSEKKHLDQYSIGPSGYGVEVEFVHVYKKMAIMIVDEDRRLKLSYAVVGGENKSFTPFGELEVWKHHAEVDILCTLLGDIYIIDVSKRNLWEFLTFQTGRGLALPGNETKRDRNYKVAINYKSDHHHRPHPIRPLPHPDPDHYFHPESDQVHVEIVCMDPTDQD